MTGPRVAAFCPAPPLLVPGVTGGPVAAADALRSACRDAVTTVLATRPGAVTLVAAGPVPADHGPRWWPPESTGTVAGLGVADPAGSGDDLLLPMSLAVGHRLLADAGWSGPVEQVTVPVTAAARDCLALGASLAGRCLLVLADGSNRRGDKPPGGPHPGAEDLDAVVADALDRGDPGALARLDTALSAELGADGRAPWQVLAGWAGRRRVVDAALLHHAAPFGVGYLVGTWTVTG